MLFICTYISSPESVKFQHEEKRHYLPVDEWHCIYKEICNGRTWLQSNMKHSSRTNSHAHCQTSTWKPMTKCEVCRPVPILTNLKHHYIAIKISISTKIESLELQTSNWIASVHEFSNSIASVRVYGFIHCTDTTYITISFIKNI